MNERSLMLDIKKTPTGCLSLENLNWSESKQASETRRLWV
jgi:hypothetical protein